MISLLKQCQDLPICCCGIGLSIHNIRATGSYNGTSNGIIPTGLQWHRQVCWPGGGKGKGFLPFTLFHGTISLSSLDLKRTMEKEEMRARDLFYALWISDLFMQRVEDNGDWSLGSVRMKRRARAECYGKEFESLCMNDMRKKARPAKPKAQELWFAKHSGSMTETGTPRYVFTKMRATGDQIRRILGIKSSNLYGDSGVHRSGWSVAVCNLASPLLCPSSFGPVKFDHQKLFEVTYVVLKNLEP